jgi:hypothetical protein
MHVGAIYFFIVMLGCHVLQSMLTDALLHSRVNTPLFGAVSLHTCMPEGR